MWSFMRDRISSNNVVGSADGGAARFLEVESMNKEVKYHYEKQHTECSRGDIFKNTNGSSYRVMEKYSDSNMLLQNIDTGMFVVGVGVEFFRKLPRPSEEEHKKAKELINEYCLNEFDSGADFGDLKKVPLAFTHDLIPELGKEDVDIQVSADIVNFKIITEIDGTVAGIEQYDTMGQFIEYELSCLDYGVLVSVTDDEILVAKGQKKLNPNLADVSMEWGHGIYLSNVPSEIDFAKLKREYARLPEPNARGEFDIEIREVLSRTESVKAGYLGEAIDALMDRYKRGEIVLDAGDFKEVDYIPQHGKGSR